MHTVKKCKSVSIFKLTLEIQVVQRNKCTSIIIILKFIIWISDISEHLKASFLNSYFLICSVITWSFAIQHTFL